MQSDATRAAFTLSLIHQRRDDQRITAVAVLQHGSRVFLGLDNGVLEEHRCSPATAAGALPAIVAAAAGGMLQLRLLAEKKIFSRQAVVGIAPAEAAARLVCMSEDGQVALVSLETFAVLPLPAARNAAALAVQPSAHLPVLLAVAVRAGKGRSKVLVFSILPGANVTGSHQPAILLAQVAVPEAVLGLAWAGKSLLLAVPGGYHVLKPVAAAPSPAGSSSPAISYQLSVLADHLAAIQPMLGSIPELGLGLMLWEENMVLVTDAAGAAVREPLQLPMQPIALAAAGLFVVALCDDGIHVFDHASSSREVQHIDYAHDDAYVRLSNKLPTAADAGGRCICMATSSQVLRLEPIAIEQQVRELLKRKRFDQALDLIQHSISAAADPSSRPRSPLFLQQQQQQWEQQQWEQSATAIAARSSLAAGQASVQQEQQQWELSPTATAAAAAARRSATGGHSTAWQQVALAQAGMLLLLECDWEAALSVLEQLDVATWQPCQLFALFPGVTARWRPKVPARSYWGLHGLQLPELTQLITDMLELKAATAPVGQQQQHWRQQQQQQHVADDDYRVAEAAAGHNSAEAPWVHGSHFRQTTSHISHSSGGHSSSSNGRQGGSSSSLSSSSTALGVNPAEVQGLVRLAKAAIAAYFTRVRTRPGVVLLDGIDTLLLQLQCDVGDAAAVETLLCGCHHAEVAAAAAALKGAGRWHALALLQINAGQPKEALQTWQALAAGQLTEASSDTGAVAEAAGDAAAVAVASAAATMAAGPDVVPLGLLMDSADTSASSSSAVGSSSVAGTSSSSTSSSSDGGFLRWLLGQDATASLAVLECRTDLNPQAVLQLLEDAADIDLRWQYLFHLVHHNCSSNGSLHTQLATVLITALVALVINNNNNNSSSSSSSSSDANAGVPVSSQHLAQMAPQLPVCFTPNTATADVASVAATAPATATSSGAANTLSQSLGYLPSKSSAGFSISGGSKVASKHSRHPSMMGAGIPSACYFAASVADITRRSSRDMQLLLTAASHLSGPAAAAASGASTREQQQQRRQQHQPYSHQAHQQKRAEALAGSPVFSKQAAPQTLTRQGTATAHGFQQAARSLSGFGMQDQSLSTLGKTLSNITQMLQQQQYLQGSSSGPANAEMQGLVDGVQHEAQGLRVLPAGLGPWPVEPQHPGDNSSSTVGNQAAAAATAAESACAVAQSPVGSSGSDRPAATATAAAAAAAYDKVLLLRCLLVYHLQASLLYDAKVVLTAAADLPLHLEQALLYSRIGNHQATLALMALAPPRLVEGAIAYCRALDSQEAWLALLELFLNPTGVLEGLAILEPSTQGIGRALTALQGLVTPEPDYASACRVLNAEGASLNPSRLLAALPREMPLHLAGDLLGYVVSGMQHRRRYGQVVRNLYRCQRLSAHADLTQLQAQRVLLTDDTACHGCGRLIGSKVFYRYPSGVVVCSRCSGAVAAASGTASPGQ